ncbi:hypothetical protein JCGZ_26386 [Jatropha curcas]|uniref:BHLH domain-containing protein n=1 Tax=Jatropha curcas TaxID=180498 RepID=A0A067JRD3_JATCU|nr:transcription factor bHLH137 [Jatropha curcas]KDP22555.1 hypothetical protein JCGZ_26386 [Jatropha curcas]
MATFSSNQHYPSHLDSVFLPNTPFKNLSGFMEEANIINNTNSFSQFYPPHQQDFPQIESPPDVRFYYAATSLLDHNNSSMVALSDNEPSVTKKQSTESSTVVDKLESGEQVTQMVTPMPKKRKYSNGSSCNNSSQSKDGRDGRSKKQRKCNSKKEEDKKPKAEKKVTEQEPPTGYIHVRARRGQATDSHSLAERVRREKISERMKILQKIVPGCDKVTGKALMLDEIINYVQSLQNQVEFLSLKLASVNPLFYDFGMDLDALMVRPEGLMGNLAPSLPPMQQCTTATATATATATTTPITTTTATFATANNYPLIDSSALLLLQEQRPNDFIQDSNSLLWDVDEQRQKFLNPSGFTNNLCSFH